jgi:hypothetical protein
MKSNKLLIALALCAAMQPGISFGAQTPQTEEPAPVSQSYWQQYAPQFMQDTRSAIAKKYEDSIGKWSTKNKLILLGAILTTLGVGAYYRNEIMQMISDARAGKVEGGVPQMINGSILTQKPELTGGSNIPEISNIDAENVESIGNVTLYPNKKDVLIILREQLKAASDRSVAAEMKRDKALIASHVTWINRVPEEIQHRFLDQAMIEKRISDFIDKERDYIYKEAILAGVPKEEADAILQVGRNIYHSFNWKGYRKALEATVGALKNKND